jgi:hypothetical protein
MFASLVGLIGGIHLLSTAANRFGRGIYYSGNQQKKREDWYCFFQPSDLLGTDRRETENMDDQQPVITESERLEQRRRQQANRPRLQL